MRIEYYQIDTGRLICWGSLRRPMTDADIARLKLMNVGVRECATQ